MVFHHLRIVCLLWSCIILVPHETQGQRADCSDGGKKKIVCYYPNWAYWRAGAGKYTVEDIDVNLCTHVIYAFTILDPSSFTLKAHDTWLDLDSGLGNFRKFVSLRDSNPNLKLIMAIGGWTDSRTTKYSTLLADPAKRQHFVEEVVKFLSNYGFDGLDLDYEYPSYDGQTTDRAGFTALVRELRQAFDDHDWDLTAAVSASKSIIDAGYDVVELSGHLDAIHLMTYDLHGSWETQADHHAPLYKRDFEATDLLTVDFAVNYWLSLGTPKEKLIVGIPTYGRSFTLSGQDTSPQAPASGKGQPGPVTNEGGQLSYQEICLKIQNHGWNVVQDPTHKMGPYAYKGNQWVGYDDPAMAEVKANYILDHQLGGAMFWDLPSDDFNNRCGQGKYPIISKVAETLQNGDNCQSTTHSSSVTTKPTSVPTSFSSSSPAPTTTAPATPSASITATTSMGTTTRTPSEELCSDVNGIYPDPSDCGKYYQCGWGVPYSFSCPPGTLYSTNCKCCDWAANVQCTLVVSVSIESVTSILTTPASPTTIPARETSSAPTEELCSDPNGIYPNPSDCSKYYQCGWGVPYPYTCPAGTLFSTSIKNCDWEANVQCNSDSSGTTENSGLTSKPEELCSDVNGIYPDPADCGKYYQCGWGMPYSFNCPPGTLYSTICKCCDWAANVQCMV